MKDPSVLVESTQENNEWDLLSTKRSIEWLAMHYITNAVRCQGRLTPERRELLKRVSSFFGISNDRYQAEIRRALSDKCLSAIAELVEGPNTEDEWMQEGRNSVPCVPKGQPPTIYTEYADEIARLFNESDVDDDDDADDDDDINDYEEETRSDDLKTGVLGILEPKSDICGTQVVVEDPTFQFTQLWGVKYEDSECVFSQSTHYDTDTSSGQESQSTVSESELSSMSTAQATSNDEKPLVKEVEVENAAEVEEKNVVIEVISDEESRESFIKKELDEDSSKKQLTPTTLKPEDKDGNDNLRKRKASFDGPPPIPQKLPAGSLPKISTVAVTTRAVNLQPNYKFSISNPVNSRTSVAVTPAAQKVIIVSSAGAVNNPSILQRSLCSTVVKMATTIATTPVLSTVSHVQPVTSSAVTVKQKPKTVSIPAKCRDPIVIRSQNIQLKSSPSVSHCSQDVSLKRIPVSGISTAAKILTKSGACGKSGVGGGGSGGGGGGGGGHVLVMNTSVTSSATTRNTVSVVGQRLTVPVRTHIPPKQDVSGTTFQTTKIIQGTSANSKPVIVLQKGGVQTNTQRGVTLTTATKELVNKVLMSKNVSTLSRPLVSVQKAATMLKPGTNLPFSTSQGNVIVLDLSQEHISKNATLAEILQASGIICDNTTSTSNNSSTIPTTTATNSHPSVTAATASSAISASVATMTASTTIATVSCNPSVVAAVVTDSAACAVKTASSSSLNISTLPLNTTIPITVSEIKASNNCIIPPNTVPLQTCSTTIVPTKFNSGIMTTCTSTIMSSQVSDVNTESEAQDWTASHNICTEGATFALHLPFSVEEGIAEPVEESDEVQELHEEKADIESVSGSTTESDEETCEGVLNVSAKLLNDNLVPSEGSCGKEKEEKSDLKLIQGASSCNIEILSSSDVSLDSLQLMQVDAIGELPSEGVAYINEESQESSVNGNGEDSDENLQGKNDETSSQGDVNFFRQGSTDNTMCSVTTEDGSDCTSVTGVSNN